MELLIGLTVPMAGTALGAALVFLIRDRISQITNNAMLGFASGIMVAASFWSLLQPALEQTGDGLANNWPVIVGFIAGMGFLLLLDTIIPHQHSDNEAPEGPKSSLSRSTKMILAVGLHNIPEGMAVSVPLIGGGMGKAKAVLITALSGVPTMIGALLGYLLGDIGAMGLALSLGFASGAMLYVVFGEILPQAILMYHSKLPAFSAIVGMLVGLFIIYY